MQISHHAGVIPDSHPSATPLQGVLMNILCNTAHLFPFKWIHITCFSAQTNNQPQQVQVFRAEQEISTVWPVQAKTIITIWNWSISFTQDSSVSFAMKEGIRFVPQTASYMQTHL